MKRVISLLIVVLILAMTSAVAVGAIESPTKANVWNITVGTEGSGTATADRYQITHDDEGNITLNAEDGNDKFVRWKITGDYTIISGDLTSRTLTIKPGSDLNAVAVFSSGQQTTSSSTSSGTNSGSTSPKTGSFTYVFILTLIALAAGVSAVMISRKVKR